MLESTPRRSSDVAPPTAAPSRTVRVIATALTTLLGGAAAVQSLNAGRLTESIGNGFAGAALAGTVFCVVGLLAIGGLVVVWPTQRRLVPSLWRTRKGRRSGWEWPATTAGTIVAVSQAALVPAIGVALYTIGFVAGQTIFGLVADRLGLGPGDVRKFTILRLTATALALAGVMLAVAGGFDTGSASAGIVLLAPLPGAAVAIQSAANGRLAVATGAPLPVALVNFVLGTAVLLVLTAITFGAEGRSFDTLGDPSTWWAGTVGAAFVVASAFAVPVLGVLVFTLSAIAGQVLGSLALELLTAPGGTTQLWRLALSSAIVVAAVALTALREHGPAKSPAVPAGPRAGDASPER
jgi:bacterial/archaeal transporter family-2 protein